MSIGFFWLGVLFVWVGLEKAAGYCLAVSLYCFVAWLAMGNEYRWLLALKKPQAKD